MSWIHASSIVSQDHFDPYQELALSIIEQAASDYRSLARKVENSGSAIEKRRLQSEMKEISRFFLSDWYCQLADSNNGAIVLEMLDQEVFGDD